MMHTRTRHVRHRALGSLGNYGPNAHPRVRCRCVRTVTASGKAIRRRQRALCPSRGSSACKSNESSTPAPCKQTAKWAVRSVHHLHCRPLHSTSPLEARRLSSSLSPSPPTTHTISRRASTALGSTPRSPRRRPPIAASRFTPHSVRPASRASMRGTATVTHDCPTATANPLPLPSLDTRSSTAHLEKRRALASAGASASRCAASASNKRRAPVQWRQRSEGCAPQRGQPVFMPSVRRLSGARDLMPSSAELARACAAIMPRARHP